MTKKIEITLAIAHDVIGMCLTHNRYDIVETLAKAINAPAPVEVVVKKASPKKAVAKKRVRKPKEVLVVVDETPSVAELDEAEKAREKKRDYMRARRAKNAKVAK